MTDSKRIPASRVKVNRWTWTVLVASAACSVANDESAPQGRKILAESPDARGLVESLRARFVFRDDGSSKKHHDQRAEPKVRSIFPPGAGAEFVREAGRLEQRSFRSSHSRSSISRAAHVMVPERAHGVSLLTDENSSVSLEARLLGAVDSVAEAADGYVVFRDGFGPGSHVLHHVTETGYEDYVTFEQAPAEEKLEYELALGHGAAGLRLVGNALEIVDASGTPRLHVSSPWLLGQDGTRTDATLAVNDCAVDRDPSVPWGRLPIAPGANHCTLEVSWSGAHYPAVLDPEWGTTGSMVNARYQHTMIRLPSGQVFTAGGSFGPYGISTAELYDPDSGTWATTNSMSIKRWGATTTLLEDGTVLVAGGNECTEYDAQGYCTTPDLRSVEIFDPRLGTWSIGTPMSFAREMATATRLLDGTVLVSGGNWIEGDKTAETYDPVAKRWSLTRGKMSVTRWASTADRLGDGRVLVTGGWSGSDLGATATAEIFDPSSRTFTPTGSLSVSREEHSSVMLPNGDVMIVAGTSAFKMPPGSPRLETELYHPASEQFTLLTRLPAGRAYSAVGLASPNYVLAAAGMELSSAHSNAIIYDIRQNSWHSAGSVSEPKTFPGVVALANNDLMVCGGYAPQLGTVGTCEKFSQPTDGALCGDGTRASATEECDLAQGNGSRATCSASCRGQDVPVTVDSSTARARSRTLGLGAHPIAGWPSGATAAAYVETRDGVPVVVVAGIGSNGVPKDKAITVSPAPSAIAGSDPVLAPIADDVGVVAFTDSGADGHLLGVGLRRVYPLAGAMGPLVRANARTNSSQFDADVVFTGSQIVVAWADDSDLSTGPDIYYRAFDTALNPVTAADQALATSPDSEGNVSLVRFGAGWAAAWRASKAGLETIHVKAGDVEWTVGPFQRGPFDERPSLMMLDSTHLLVAFTEGTDLATPGDYSEGRIRAAVLGTSAPGNVTARDVVAADSVSRDQPKVARVGSSFWMAWRERPTAEPANLLMKELVWDPQSYTLDLTRAPVPLPRSAQRTDRQTPALIDSSPERLVAGWTEPQRIFGESRHRGDVMIEVLQVPVRRLP